MHRLKAKQLLRMSENGAACRSLNVSMLCRVGLALLKTGEDQLAGLPYEQLLHALKAKQLCAH